MKPDTTDAQAPAAPTLWRGLEEYMDSPAFRAAMRDEFPEDAAEWTDPVTRRNFLTVMGASLALAGAGCSPRPAPMRQIVPYTRQPEQIVPGIPLFFATANVVAGYAVGLLLRSHEGRPVKVEGNPDHPSSLGGTSAIDQASVLDLYDPDRSQQPTRWGEGTGYETVLGAVRGVLYEPNGQPRKAVRLRVLTGAVTSPTLADQVGGLLTAFPEARWCQYEACGQDNAREGARRAFGRELTAVYDFAKADVVLSLDADFLGTGPGHVRYCRDFAGRRKVRQNVPAGSTEFVTPDRMNRLYAVEAMPTVTGSSADHRLALPASQVENFARALAARLGVGGAPVAGTLPPEAQKWLDPLAKDIQGKKGAAVVVAGEDQPPSLHALAHAINAAIGAVGQTVRLVPSVEERPAGKVIDLKTLVGEMNAGAVDALLILGGTNPGYACPADLKFAAAVKKVPFRFHLGLYQDETAALCEWHLNEAHYLEAWGDARGHDGTPALQQPLIAPLYAGRSAAEFLADLTNAPTAREGREVVKAYWKKWYAGAGQSREFEQFWQESVRLGVIADPGRTSAQQAGLAGNWAEGAAAVPSAPSGDNYEINFRADSNVFDGRYANNGWLQELPHAVTKISWDNAAFVGMETAKRLDIDTFFRWTAGERGRAEVRVVELEYKGNKVKAPLWALPGHPEGVVTVHLGYGRERAGRVGNAKDEPNADGKQTRGFNAYVLRTSDAPAFAGGLAVRKTGGEYFLACLQGNWVMTQIDPISGRVIHRDPVRRGTVGEYRANPSFPKIPPTAAGETDAITHNIPGPAGKGEAASGTQYREGSTYGPTHDHSHGDHGHGDEHGGHDSRLLPLTMYHPNNNLYPDARRKARRWGMAIDLSACTGCNACMVACQSENNTPVVGKREVTRGHDMYWLRIDRYYDGPPGAPDGNRTYFQPVPCQQCEKAPCEVVCPVAATVHSADGLNDMVYNRCVGTRYCSNNCPYKVRRFNFFTFQDWYTASFKLGRNPDVTVRSRGVMEKCTYCVQRIRFAEIAAERQHREIADGEVRTACQSACPAGAIEFGDLQDPAGKVGRWKAEPTNYGLLAELNTMPRTTYLANLRNPNPDLK
ncbi:MAG: TAT-variant-translocated molybdopterin oxidoreductase [Gemmataceae bacterium]|nr:TAT-variant-translocated molybdopterin oxidoreductase [Gemmataceae bacterium]